MHPPRLGDGVNSRAGAPRPPGRSMTGATKAFVTVDICHPQWVNQCEMQDQSVSADEGGEMLMGMFCSSQALQGACPKGEKGLLFPPSVLCPQRSISSSSAPAPYPNVPLLVHPSSISDFAPLSPGHPLLFTSSPQSFLLRTKHIVPQPHPCQTTSTEISWRGSQLAHPRSARVVRA